MCFGSAEKLHGPALATGEHTNHAREADTEKGSSGAPVFNDFWEVVALHHSGVPRTDEQGRLVDANGKVLGAGDAEQYEWVANEGVRVSRIVAAVAAAELPEHMHAVREKAMRAWEVRGQPAAAVEAPLSPVSDQPSTAPQEEDARIHSPQAARSLGTVQPCPQRTAPKGEDFRPG